MLTPNVHDDDLDLNPCRDCDGTGCHWCDGMGTDNRYELQGLDDREPIEDDSPAAYITHVGATWAARLTEACEQASADLDRGAYLADCDDVTGTVWYVDGLHREPVCHVNLMTQRAHVDAETGVGHDPMLWALEMHGFDASEDETITIETRMAAREVRR